MNSPNMVTTIIGGLIALAGFGLLLTSLFLFAFGGFFANPYGLAFGVVGGGYLLFRGVYTLRRNLNPEITAADVPVRAVRTTVEDRLDELERLKRRDMVTPQEYAAKRQEILKDL